MSTSDSSKAHSTSDADATLHAIVQGLSYSARTPILHTPAELGLEYEDIYFPSADGTVLEGWLIPRAGSDKLVICSHPFKFNRAGFPSHLEPWKSSFGPGNDFELNFVPDFKLLHDAGYAVLAYDFRNFGLSGAANGGLTSNSRFEARDVVGSLAYTRARPDLARMKVALFSRCMGANATFRAIAADPRPFDGVRCMVAPLLLTVRVVLERTLEGAGLSDRFDEADRALKHSTGTPATEASPADWAPSVKIPTLTYGVRSDPITRSSDLETIYKAIGTEEKSMFWIDGTTRRWDGYTYFQREPKKILDWLEKYM